MPLRDTLNDENGAGSVTDRPERSFSEQFASTASPPSSSSQAVASRISGIATWDSGGATGAFRRSR